MANEATVNASLSYAKGNIASKTLGVTGKSINVSGTNYVEGSQTIATSATALIVGNLGSLGLFCIKNNDPTNPIDLMTSTSGAHFMQILPGECVVGRFPSAVTAPAAIATGGSVNIEYLIVEP